MLPRIRTRADRIYLGVTRSPREAGIMPVNAGSVTAGNRRGVMTRMKGLSRI